MRLRSEAAFSDRQSCFALELIHGLGKNSLHSALTVLLAAVLACASTLTHEGSGEYVDDSVITANLKAAMLQAPDVKSSEIHVETFKSFS
jgi:osmotically-inducible protein OsmY